jgi:hypothetical protein
MIKNSYYSLVSTATWTFHFAVIVQWYMDAIKIKTIIYIYIYIYLEVS